MNTMLPIAVLGAGYRQGAKMHWDSGSQKLSAAETPRVFDLNVSNFIVFFKCYKLIFLKFL